MQATESCVEFRSLVFCKVFSVIAQGGYFLKILSWVKILLVLCKIVIVITPWSC